MTQNFLGYTFLRCFHCQKELNAFDKIDYCDWNCHFEDYFNIRKKQKRTDIYFKG